MSTVKFEIWLGLNCIKKFEVNLDAVEEICRLTVEVLKVSEIKKRIANGDISFDPPIAHGIVAPEARGII